MTYLTTNPLDYPRYVRGIRPVMVESLPAYLEEELEKVQNSMENLAVASDENSKALVSVETTERVDADGALAQQITTVQANVDDNAAAITNEITARADGDSALASQITTLTSTVNSNTAAITSESTTRANADSALSSQITTLTSTVNSNTAAISSEATTRANADSAISSRIDTIEAEVDGNAAAITTEQTARASADSAISQNVTNLTTTVDGHTSTISSHSTSINGLQAKYGVTLDVNGYITGFSQNNDGSSGSFDIVADKFRVYVPGVGAKSVFSISGSDIVLTGDVAINGSLLVNGTVTSSEVAQSAVSITAFIVSEDVGTTSGYALNTWVDLNSIGTVGSGGSGGGTGLPYYKDPSDPMFN